MSAGSLEAVQRALCARWKAPYLPTSRAQILGIARNVQDNIQPIHGLRHPARGETCGWYIWAGEWSSKPDFFQPLHVSHLDEWCPEIVRFLGLAPGWRFLIDDQGYVDVWEDRALLDA